MVLVGTGAGIVANHTPTAGAQQRSIENTATPQDYDNIQKSITDMKRQGDVGIGGSGFIGEGGPIGPGSAEGPTPTSLNGPAGDATQVVKQFTDDATGNQAKEDQPPAWWQKPWQFIRHPVDYFRSHSHYSCCPPPASTPPPCGTVSSSMAGTCPPLTCPPLSCPQTTPPPTACPPATPPAGCPPKRTARIRKAP